MSTPAASIERFRHALEGCGATLAGVVDRAGLPGRLADSVGEGTYCAWTDPLIDTGLMRGSAAEPAQAEFSIVWASLGIVRTGTIALVHGEGRSRQAGLLPERQIAVLRAEDLVETVVDATSRLFGGLAPAAAASNVVLVTGPSRTADIEQQTLIGVHSPRKIQVILVKGSRAAL